MRRPEVREWRRRKLHGPWDEPVSALPTTSVGEWLRTGPDTMPGALRNRLHRLELFAEARWEKLGIAAKGRDFFLETPREFDLFLKVKFAMEHVQRLTMRPGLPFLKSRSFAAAVPRLGEP